MPSSTTDMLTSLLQLGSSEPQTLHLVLRPTGPDPPIHPSTPFIPPQRVTTPIPPQIRPQSTPANPIHGMHAQQPLPGFQHQHHAIHQAEHWQNVLGQRLQALQRETARLQQEMGNIEQRSRALASAHPDVFSNQHERTSQAPQAPPLGTQAPHIPQPLSFRPTIPMNTSIPPPPQIPAALQHLLHQGQNERASAETRHGLQGFGSEMNPTIYRQTRSGRASPNIIRPDHSTTYSREGIGPNGERWQMTVNETTSTFQIPQHPLMRHHDHNQVYGAQPALDSLQAIARTTDRLLASQRSQSSQNMQNNPTEPNNQLPPTAVDQGPQALPVTAPPSSTLAGAASQATAPLPQSSTYNPQHNPNTTTPGLASFLSYAHGATGSTEPMVYILSSPQGPQALLLNNSATYFAHPLDTRRRRAESPAANTADQTHAVEQDPVVVPELQNRAAQRPARRGNRHQQEDPPFEPVGVPHGNPGAGALGARIGPMIWLIIRLTGFVWFFTAGNNSWPRFVMITGLAVVVFIINTGIFNGIAEALWGPVRRHVEALIPLAGPEAALVPAANAAAVPQERQPEAAPQVEEPRPRRRNGELDEAEVAARLLRQHREMNAEWWLAQIRRAEHAALLFLASLVPGVGERHIAAREAAANAAEAERQRQNEAAAATENPQDENPEVVPEHSEGGGQENQEHQPRNNDGVGDPAATQPVIAEA